MTLRKEQEIINGVGHQSEHVEAGDLDVKEKEKELFEKGAVADVAGVMPVAGS